MRGREFIVENKIVTALFFSNYEFMWVVYEDADTEGDKDLELVGVFVREHKMRAAMKQWMKEELEFRMEQNPEHFDEEVLAKIHKNYQRFFKTEKTNLI